MIYMNKILNSIINFLQHIFIKNLHVLLSIIYIMFWIESRSIYCSVTYHYYQWPIGVSGINLVSFN